MPTAGIKTGENNINAIVTFVALSIDYILRNKISKKYIIWLEYHTYLLL